MDTNNRTFAPKYCPSKSHNLQIDFTAFVHNNAIPMMLQYHFHFPPKKRKFDTDSDVSKAHKVNNNNNSRKGALGIEGRQIPFSSKR